MSEIAAIVLADPAPLAIASGAPSADARLLGLSLAWRAVLTADRLGAATVFVAGPEALVAGIEKSPHRVSARLATGSVLDLVPEARPAGTIALVLCPWVLLEKRHMRSLIEKGERGLTLAVTRASDPVRPWPELRCHELVVATMARELSHPDGQALPVIAGPWRDVVAVLRDAVGEDGEALSPARWARRATAAFHPEGSYQTLLLPRDFRRAASWLFAGLGSSADGIVDKHLNRRVSKYVTLAVVNGAVTPNHITLASFALGLLAVGAIATGSYGLAVLGAALLQVSAMVDCADGELARLKYLESPFGAKLDIALDNVVHMLLFVAVGWSVSRTEGPLAVKLGIASAIGAAISFGLVYTALFGRKAGGAGAGPVERFIDKMTNRDFSLLLLACAVAGKLAWFLWALAIGVQAFWLALLAIRIQAWTRARESPDAAA
ncbi:MAG: CDP-alcohol phosphatidyltransferase family protein [Acidobacteriota bacterium]